MKELRLFKGGCLFQLLYISVIEKRYLFHFQSGKWWYMKMNEKAAVVWEGVRVSREYRSTSPAVVFTLHISLTTKSALKYSRKLAGNVRTCKKNSQHVAYRACWIHLQKWFYHWDIILPAKECTCYRDSWLIVDWYLVPGSSIGLQGERLNEKRGHMGEACLSGFLPENLGTRLILWKGLFYPRATIISKHHQVVLLSKS